MFFFLHKRSRSKFDLRSRSRGHPKTSCCLSSDASRQEKRNETNRMSLSFFNRQLLAKTIHDLRQPLTGLRWPHRGHKLNKWCYGLDGPKILLESCRANWSLWMDLYALFDFSIVFQWRGHDLISDLRSPNKKILGMHFAIVHCLTPHANFQNPCSKTVGPTEGQS